MTLLKHSLLTSAALAGLASIASTATPAEWRGRSIYQVLTDRFAQTDGSTSAACNTQDGVYCGGTWQGLIQKLDYIQGMGFTAIWISPVTQQILETGNSADGSSYHGYWQNDLYALNSNFGSVSDLQALATAVHNKGMYLMIDVVANHFAWPGNYDTVDYSTYTPFNSVSYFHPYCPITQQDYDDNNQTAINDCWLGDSNVELTDVNTDDFNVQQIYSAWISSLVSNYSADGLRVDTVKNVQKSFWPGFNNASGVYNVGEVDDGDPSYVLDYQNYIDGTLNYPLYYPLTSAFQSTSGDISSLVDMVNTIKDNFPDSTLLGTFLENHDNPRFPSYTSDMALDMNAIAFAMLADGVPIVYQGQEQHFSGGAVPLNREALWTSDYDTSAPLYTFIATINQIRNHAIYCDSNYLTYKAYPIYNDTTTIAMRKGYTNYQIVGVFSNKGSDGAAYTQNIPSTGFAASATVVEVLGCSTTTADSQGNIVVDMGQGAVKVYYPAAQLKGSGICGY